MPVYLIADFKVTDEAWMPDYAANVHDITMEALQAFADDPAYAPYARARQDGTVSRFHVIDDADAAGTIPYLPKG